MQAISPGPAPAVRTASFPPGCRPPSGAFEKSPRVSHQDTHITVGAFGTVAIASTIVFRGFSCLFAAVLHELHVFVAKSALRGEIYPRTVGDKMNPHFVRSAKCQRQRPQRLAISALRQKETILSIAIEFTRDATKCSSRPRFELRRAAKNVRGQNSKIPERRQPLSIAATVRDRRRQNGCGLRRPQRRGSPRLESEVGRRGAFGGDFESEGAVAVAQGNELW